MTTRLAYLVTHPIQYQAPLLRRIAADPSIDLTVFFGSDFSLRRHLDPGFGQAIEWDVPLLEGYRSEVLAHWRRDLADGESPSCWRPFSRGLRSRLTAGRFDALWVHGYNRASHWMAIAIARRQGLKVLLRDEATTVSAARGPLKRWAKQQFFHTLDRGIDGYLAIGSLNRAYYRDQGIADAKLFAMPYAVDNDWFQDRIAAAATRREAFRQELNLHRGRPVVLFAGKLIARKRPFDLLEAVRRLPHPQPYLLFAGDGVLRPDLERAAASLGLEGVRVLGFQSQARLAALYDLCDVFVLPSERESWGLVVNEVMNAGRAVIVNDRVGSGADLVRPGENGFVYPCGDVGALKDRLADTLADPGRTAAFGMASRRIIDGWGFDQDLAGLKAALGTIGTNPAAGGRA